MCVCVCVCVHAYTHIYIPQAFMPIQVKLNDYEFQKTIQII